MKTIQRGSTCSLAQQSVGRARESAMADDGDQDSLNLGAISSTFSGLTAQQVQNMNIRNDRLHRQLLNASQRVATQHASDVKPDVPDVIMTGATWHHMTPGMLPLDPHLTLTQPTLNHLLTCSYTFPDDAQQPRKRLSTCRTNGRLIALVV